MPGLGRRFLSQPYTRYLLELVLVGLPVRTGDKGEVSLPLGSASCWPCRGGPVAARAQRGGPVEVAPAPAPHAPLRAARRALGAAELAVAAEAALEDVDRCPPGRQLRDL